mmetsp:Transcript_18171/g.43734  ORF Transcript_18171/g.43734 Transcript_18171/m.43734 type:complete len:1270 (-) Transcript_18171:138-3947(-)
MCPPSGTWGTAITVEINGKTTVVQGVDPNMRLANYLRDAGLTGTRIGCGEGGCGACTVFLERIESDGEIVRGPCNACLLPLYTLDGASIRTTEGIKQGGEYHPVQRRIADFNGSQCGFCTPGMVMSIYSSLRKSEGDVTMAQVDKCLDGNLCRCTGFRPILDAGRSFARDSDVKTDIPVEFLPLDQAREPSFPDSLKAYVAASPKKVFQSATKTIYVPTSLDELAEAIELAGETPFEFLYAGTSKGIFKEDSQQSAGVPETEARDVVISLHRVAELKQAAEIAQDVLVVGAGRSIQHLIDFMMRQADDGAFPAVVQHLQRIAGSQVRNVGSLAGNVMLAKKRGFESDLSTVLLGLGAKVSIRTGSKESTVPYEEFLSATWDERSLLTKLLLPTHPLAVHCASYKVGIRPQNCHAQVNATMVLETDDMVVRNCRISVGGIAFHALRLRQVEDALQGQELNDSLVQKAFELAGGAVPNPDHGIRREYRRQLAASLVRKFLTRIVSPAESDDVFVKGPNKQELAIDDSLKPVGLAIPKTDAILQAAGEAKYTDDFSLPHMLHAVLVGAKAARGRVRNVHKADALAVEGVVAVLDSSDLPHNRNITYSCEPMLADSVEFWHQPIAVVLGETLDAARRGAVKVMADIEEMKPLLTVEDCIEAGATSTPGSSAIVEPEGGTEALTTAFSGAAEKDTDMVLEGKISMAAQQHFYMEPQTALAHYDEGVMYVSCSMQNPTGVVDNVARCCDLPWNSVVVEQRRAGGGFGGKLTRHIRGACTAALCAKITGRPVKLTLDRNTDTKLIGGRPATKCHYKVIVDKATGDVKGIDLRTTMEGGAYSDPGMASFSAMSFNANFGQCYNFGGPIRLEVMNAATSVAPRTACRAPGEPDNMLATEVIVDHIAAETGLDPHDLRARLLFPADAEQQGIKVPSGKEIKHYTVPQMWDKLLSTASIRDRMEAVKDFNAKHKTRKRGLSMIPLRYINYCQKGSALLNLYQDGTLVVTTNGCEIGQGLAVKVNQAVIYTLNTELEGVDVPLSSVRTLPTNSTYLSNMGMTGGSMTSEASAAAAAEAAKQFAQQLKPLWDEVKASENPTWAGLAKSAIGKNLAGVRATNEFSGFYFSWGVGASEVEVDVLTGEVQVLRADILYDCGKSLNPAVDMGQAEGAFVMGLGYYLSEEVIIDDTGRLFTDGTWEYKPPFVGDVPQMNISFLEDSPFEKGFLSSKCSGEPPLILAASAFIAVRHAVRAARSDLRKPAWFSLDAPASPERVFQAIHA